MGRLKVASLFCGCGGMDLGILGGFDFLDTNYPRSAFDIVYAVDNDPYCTKIYNANFEHKCQIKDAIEKIFKVKVESVNTVNVHPKKKRVGRYSGMTNKYKKAIVTLVNGNKIDL